MLRASYPAIAFWCAMTICGNAYAHRPTMSDGSASQPAKAIEFKDVQISRVVYHEVTPQAPRVWITFEVSQPQKLRLQLGVPLIDRLRDYRPALALVGAGLPKVELPFELPGDSGGRVFDTRDSAPRTFHEPFTGTSSWILSEQDVELPAAGRYYVVAHDPSGNPGKLWVALGTKEDWGPKDFLELPRIIAEVRGFHELTATKDPTSKPDRFRVICDFDTPASSGEWTAVNDNVMGGVSEGQHRITGGGTLEFTGTLSLENNGGFASIRSRPAGTNLAEFDGLLIRVRGDGKRYAFNLQTDVPIRAGSYRLNFETKASEWREIPLAFADFQATSFGEVIRDVPSLDPAKIRSFGLTISDKQAGPFKLEVDWIRAARFPAKAGVSTATAGSPDRKAAAKELIALALQRGVPLLSGGQAEACAAVYEVTATSLVKLAGDKLPATAVARLEAALRCASRTTDGAGRARVLRKALDETAAGLEGAPD
jgi:NADH dehydrogenase [ubiquinone] 1 alpha subcomplex assembly factor 1